MKKTGLLDLQDFVPYLINRVGTALVQRFSAEALDRHDLSIAMWRVLLALWDAGTHRQIDLSDQTSIEVSTLSRLIGRLEQRKLVARVRAKTSNREVTIALTPKGRALVQELIPIAQRLEEVAIAHLPPREVDALKTTLRRVYANLTG
jgi:MarR family transcriptional regulator, organic hydroperoxide resistance regulator